MAHQSTDAARSPGRSGLTWFRLVAVAILIAAVWLLVRDPEHHADGRGPLASLGEGGGVGMSSEVGAAGRTMTFGLELCLDDETPSVTIDSIAPSVVLGSGVSFVGARMRALAWADGASPHDIVGSVEGFPAPAVDPSTLSEARGFTVTDRCQHPNPTSYTELEIGLHSDGSASGGWHGVDVGYQAGWRHRVVSIHYDLFLCRPSEPDCMQELTTE